MLERARRPQWLDARRGIQEILETGDLAPEMIGTLIEEQKA